MVRGKRAFVVSGPEGSGTRQVTRCLIAAGAFGDAGHVQRLDGLVFAGRPAAIVLRRSAPHGGRWPGLGGIAIAMQKAGYDVTALVCVRESIALARSQVAAGHARSEKEARQRIERAYRHIWGQWGMRREVRVVVAPYEAYVLHPRSLWALCGALGLEEPRGRDAWYDGNVRHYVSPELHGLGLTQAAVELLVEAGYWTLDDLARATDAELLRIPGIGEGRLAAIRAATDGGNTR